MQFFKNLIRYIGLTLLFVIPCGALGAAANGLSGGATGIATGLVILLVFAICSEWIALRHLRGRVASLDPAVKSSYAQVLASQGISQDRAPRLRYRLHPAPAVFVVRGWPSRGCICISEGLLTLLTESEIRSLFADCLRRSRAPGIRLSTFSHALTSWLLSMIPSAWTHVLMPEVSGVPRKPSPSMSVFALLGSLIALPWLKYIWLVGGHGKTGGLPIGDAVRRKMEAPGTWQFGGSY